MENIELLLCCAWTINEFQVEIFTEEKLSLPNSRPAASEIQIRDIKTIDGEGSFISRRRLSAPGQPAFHRIVSR